MLKWICVVLVVLIALLQYHLWFGEGGVRELNHIRSRADVLEQENDRLQARNDRLAAEVIDLKNGLDAIEERARSDLGMVRQDEQFFWVPGVVAERSIVEQSASTLRGDPEKASSMPEEASP
ncbi:MULTISPECIES: cell division protein FtsB [Chromohalobacter]|uniref:Cell division protein FtsB n=1 Tax=Chromohalobacter israelensis (strain ATCC BAA-138 / DSM 3043 / CIP 106854 / NCIMB 13768 / 1H11) TaxID=290398 RepID=Q1QU72_CHRI1|nr:MULTISPECIES: cell division protein FtsB [Chromohalobacter]ABE59986.1 cell division protein FtsB [Chromohalobacter salexigens DSM 3043]MDF9435312.1 cell division protein FtsB [Chromohalobacter israelensis]MDO0945787.1 cell division protein FtsB [Chromohalobacter salexigens]NQY44944.1 cell division protein FtsB [Chromohalobacter sp.]NWO56163.1 cell division protein FtsB [Chromohalobacter salexigens]